MEIKCEYCGSMIPDNVEVCPQCGAINQNFKRAADGTPKTIEELKQWYADRKLPPYEVTRFFIGIDCKEPKAIGIYEENGRFIVYKNKADGSRAVRYDGKDEDYAVNEIYLKLKSEILHQREMNPPRRPSGGSGGNNRRPRRNGNKGLPAFLIFFGVACFYFFFKSYPPIAALVVIILLALAGVYFSIEKKNPRFFDGIKSVLSKIPQAVYITVYVLLMLFIAVKSIDTSLPNYYRYNGDIYCQYDGDYYLYDNYDYVPVTDDFLAGALTPDSGYLIDDEYTTDSYYDFYDSDYYDDNFSSWSSESGSDSGFLDDVSDWWDSNSSWDSDYDWDSGSSWDSGGSDWDSDW